MVGDGIEGNNCKSLHCDPDTSDERVEICRSNSSESCSNNTFTVHVRNLMHGSQTTAVLLVTVEVHWIGRGEGYSTAVYNTFMESRLMTNIM